MHKGHISAHRLEYRKVILVPTGSGGGEAVPATGLRISDAQPCLELTVVFLL